MIAVLQYHGSHCPSYATSHANLRRRAAAQISIQETILFELWHEVNNGGGKERPFLQGYARRACAMPLLRAGEPYRAKLFFRGASRMR